MNYEGQFSLRGPVLIAAAAFCARQNGQGVDGGAGIGMWIEPPASFGADATPLADQQGATKQVGPHLHAIITPFVSFGAIAYSGE